MLLLVNPAAGGTRARELLAWLETAARPDVGLRRHVSASLDDALACIAREPPGSRVIVVGGDGTLHRWLGALMAGAHEVALIPAGSGDDTARAFGLRGLDRHEQWRLACQAPARPIDVGRIDTEHEQRAFVSSLCAGFDAAIAMRAQRASAALGGLARYLLATLQEIAALRPQRLRVTVDGATVHDGEALFASALNTPTYGGGMPIAPQALVDDGRLNLVIAGRFGRLGALAMLPRLLRGRHLNHPRVAQHVFREALIEAGEALPLAADGEAMRPARRVALTVMPRALRVVTADLRD